MVRLALPAVLLGLASAVFAAAVPNTVAGNDVEFIAARDVSEKSAASFDLATRSGDFADQINQALNKCSSGCQPHVSNIQKACKSKQPCPVVAAEVKVDLQAILALFLALVADITAIVQANPGVVISAQLCAAALQLILEVILNVCLAISASVCLPIIIAVCGGVLGQWCQAILALFLELKICLSGLVGVGGLLANLCAQIGLSVALLLQLGLGCILAILGL